MDYTRELEQSLTYLGSEAALASLARDPYWPKWDSAWWHMLLLHEMGLTAEIPERVTEAYVAALGRMPVKIFAIHAHDIPAGVDPYRGSPCHCQVGNAYQVMAARGVDVDAELPWLRPWFLRYQMADGGLNCDGDAYLVEGEVPSSMVGTIAVFEAVLKCTPRAFTAEESEFLRKGAEFLMGRRLKEGSATRYNADERASAEAWSRPCFPRFYLYDVLRGLSALLTWSERTGGTIPAASIRDVVRDLETRFPDGAVRTERRSYEGAGTLLPSAGEWLRRQPATFFPLLTKLSAVGEVSPFLSRQWADARARVARHPELRSLL